MIRANSLQKQTKLYISAACGGHAHGVCRPGRDTAVRRKRSGEAADNSAKRKDNAAKGGKRI